ncbi:MAG: PilZ domain-containing protein [Rhizobiaceae bacterium]|nr:PilZ domain-containing protein [Rhizobiaceae bacterium]
METITQNSIGIDGKVFAERRAAPRRRALKGATLRYNRGYGALECIVRNLSDNGARLAFGETAAVPSEFDFWLAGVREPRRAAVRWRGLEDVGVEFVN